MRLTNLEELDALAAIINECRSHVYTTSTRNWELLSRFNPDTYSEAYCEEAASVADSLRRDTVGGLYSINLQQAPDWPEMPVATLLTLLTHSNQETGEAK